MLNRYKYPQSWLSMASIPDGLALMLAHNLDLVQRSNLVFPDPAHPPNLQEIELCPRSSIKI
jgi:hypothetical protein